MREDIYLIKGLTSIPPGREFRLPNPRQVEEGGVVLQGFKGLALAGTLCPMDVEFILAEDGFAYFHNSVFRGLRQGVYIRIIKEDGELVFQEATVIRKADEEKKKEGSAEGGL